MSGFSSFTFGIRNYFTFTFSFQLGEPSHTPTALLEQYVWQMRAEELKAEQLERKECGAKEANEREKAIEVEEVKQEIATKPVTTIFSEHTQVSECTTSFVSRPKCCLLLDTIPLEIRQIIYAYLLVAADPIEGEQATKLLGPNQSIQLGNYSPIPGIDATVLRTCKTIYEEALPTLYGKNHFTFSGPRAISDFRDNGIDIWGLGRGFGPRRPQRRLALLCSVTLKFVPHGPSYMDPEQKMVYPWEAWSREFLNSNDFELRFPSLQNLALDFLGMKMKRNIGFRTKPFIRRLAVPKGLRSLVVIGVGHAKTIKELKDGLIKKGGKFMA